MQLIRRAEENCKNRRYWKNRVKAMNYIVLSESVYEKIKEKYEAYCKSYSYTMTADVYMNSLILYENVCRLYNRSRDTGTYAVIGEKCILYTEKYRKAENCLYAKKIRFFEEDREYLSKLSQTVELPGEWSVLCSCDADGIAWEKTQPIDTVLGSLKGSYGEFRAFEEKWKTWDIYNAGLKELEEQKERDLELTVTSTVLENDLFIIKVSEWKNSYVEGAVVSAVFEGEKQPALLGKIKEQNPSQFTLVVRCEKEELIENYRQGALGAVQTVRITDYGAKARLKRQREALKRLFEEETANPHLKEILMGDYAFKALQDKNVKSADVYSLFGANIAQKQAFAGAVNADDIYLIQGPPGTGKTTIITEIVKYAIRHDLKVLVSSETHIAVDNVLEKVCKMQGVIPVRFGKEERLSGISQKFMPDSVAQGIIQNAKETLEQYDCAGFGAEKIVENIEAAYKKSAQDILSEIEKRKSQLPAQTEYDTLDKLIQKYERAVIEANELYEELIHQKEDFFLLKCKQDELQQQKNRLEAQIHIAETGSMNSGFTESDRRSHAQLTGNLTQLEEISEKLEQLSQKLAENTYEVKQGSYGRKLNREKKYRGKLAVLTGCTDISMSDIYHMKTALSEITYFQKQAEQLEIQKNEKMNQAMQAYRHKKELWERSADIRAEWQEQLAYADTKSGVRDIYMKQTNAVFATCTGIAASDNGIFADMEYDYVIIDEAAKCNMLDLLIPMILGKKVILVGDHKQLYPVIETGEIREELTAGQIDLLKNHILFKWLYEERIPKDYKMMLNRQYRMVPDISRFVSEQFYDGALICEKEADGQNDLFWIDCESSAEEKRGTSYINLPEAQTVIALLKKLDKSYTKKTAVGIICIYKAQAEMICDMLDTCVFENIEPECSTVDAFQGKEKHTIILNLGRSSKITAFAADENRTNVAVSRAQEKFYVVGKSGLVKVKEGRILRELYEYIRQHGEISDSSYIDR